MSKKTQEMIAEELETLLLDALDIEEEEEEEELDDDDEFDHEEDEDRGDEVDPDLSDDDDDLPGDDADADGDGDADADADDFDADDLADLAGEGGDKKPSMIPHARFNEVNEALKKERAERLQLEEELARTKGKVPKGDDAGQQQQEPPAFDFKAKRKELRDALYEGNEERAEQLEDEIEAAKAAEFERRAEAKAQQLFESRQAEAEAKRIQAEVQTAATAAMTKYPLLNPEVEGHDPELLEEVIALRDFYIHQKDMSPGEAITKAADKVAGRGAAAKDDGDGKPSGKKLKPDAKPTTEQLRRNDERSRKIPPRDGGLGERASDIDWENLTEEEFENLPESVKRKERGDFVS